MLNRAPIFLNCFSRGGSNIFWNMFLTHPDVCSPILETLEIFGKGFRKARWEGYKAAFLSRQWRLFDQWYLEERKPLPQNAQAFIDQTLYEWKLKTLTDRDMKFKYEGVIYTLKEIQQARLVAKNNNGLAFLTCVLTSMYAEATFFALVRHPLSLYESHKRRKIARSVEEFAYRFERMAGKMVADAARYDQYHLVKFEDVLANPLGSMERVYDKAHLNIDAVEKVRFKAKQHFQKDGQYTTRYEPGRHYWFQPHEVHQILEPDINALHIERLDRREKERLLKLTEKSRDALGYGVPSGL
jgi:hypothetical protein